MNILLSRILTYLNGTLFIDYRYKFCQFIVKNYLDIFEMDEATFIEKSGLTKEEILATIRLFGYHEYDEFAETLYKNHMTRLDQIRARMLDVSSEQIIEEMEKSCTNEEMEAYIREIASVMDNAKRIIVIGALYPLCLSVELQTDLISYGKEVLQYHAFDTETFQFNEDDFVIYISATGRAMRAFASIKEKHLERATTLLITQNKTYTLPEYKVSDYVLQVPGKFDGINFNYQLLSIFDLLRIHYYQQYYLGE